MNDFSPDIQSMFGFCPSPPIPNPLMIGDPPFGETIALKVVRVQCRPIKTESGFNINGSAAR